MKSVHGFGLEITFEEKKIKVSFFKVNFLLVLGFRKVFAHKVDTLCLWRQQWP